jgi:hypothetical protein
MKATAAVRTLGLAGLVGLCACNEAGASPSPSAPLSTGAPAGSSSTPGGSASPIYQQSTETTLSPSATGKIVKNFSISFSGKEPPESFVQLYFPAPNVGQSILTICGNTNWGGFVSSQCVGGQGTGESGLESQDVSAPYSFQVFVNHVKVAEWGGNTMMNKSSTISTSYNWGS